VKKDGVELSDIYIYNEVHLLECTLTKEMLMSPAMKDGYYKFWYMSDISGEEIKLLDFIKEEFDLVHYEFVELQGNHDYIAFYIYKERGAAK